MSWYSAAVTGKVPSYVADKEKWDLDGYYLIGNEEYSNPAHISEENLKKAVSFALQTSLENKVPEGHSLVDTYIGKVIKKNLKH